MRLKLAVLLIGALAWSPPGVLAGAGDTQEFLCNRDSWLSDSGGEANANMGATTSGRGAKGWGAYQENTSFFDWDFAPIETFITAQMPAGYYPVFTLSVMPATWDARYGSLNLGVKTVDSVNDWAEGDATTWWTPFDWSPGTKAATVYYAQHALDAGGLEDLPNSLGWGDGSQTFPQAAALTSTDPLVVTSADVDQYASVDLSYAVMQHMRNRATTNNRGLYLTNTVDSNWELYMREHATGGEAKLTVSFSDAPLPYNWTGADAGDNNWSTAGNWDIGVPPATDDAAFTAVGGQVVVDQNTGINKVTVTGSQAWDFQDAGGGEVLTVADSFNYGSSGNSDLNVALGGAGAVNITDGRLDFNVATARASATNVTDGTAYALADGALGSGTTTINNNANLYNWFDESHGPLVVNTGGYARFAPDYNNQGAHTASATTYTVAGGTFVGNFDLPAGASVTVSDNGIFGGANNGNWGTTMDIDATVTALSDFTFRPGGGVYNSINWNGQIVGNGHTITVIDVDTNYTYSSSLDVWLTNAAQAFDGDWLIQQGVIYVTADGGLGVGSSATVDKQSRYAALVFRTEQTSVPALTARNGGIIRLDDRSGGTHEFAHDVHLEAGGILQGRDDAGSTRANLTGDLYVDGDATVQTIKAGSGAQLEISGAVRGSAKLITEADNNNDPIILSGDNTATFSGGVEAARGLLSVAATGGLGTGNAVAKGGIIRSDIDGAFDSPATVQADEGGTIDLNSTETAQIQILPMGTFKVTGGNTVLDYTPTTGNIQVSAGCVLDQSVGTGGGFPTAGQFLTGDGGYGAFLSTSSGDWSVGAPSIFRGLALPPNASVTYGDTITENASSTSGIGMLAMTGATWTFNGATFNAQPGNAIKFYGVGNFIIDGPGNTFSGPIEMHSTGKVEALAAGDVDGETLKIYNGYLRAAYDELDGATVAVEPGGVIWVNKNEDLTVNTTAPAITVGGGWYNGTQDNTLNNGAVSVTFLPGSSTIIWDWADDPGGPMAGSGKLSYVVGGRDGRWEQADVKNGIIELSADSRTTWAVNPNRVRNQSRIYARSGTTGHIALANEATSARICSQYFDDATYYRIDLPIDLAVKDAGGVPTGAKGTLIIGDTNTFKLFNINAAGDGFDWVDARQDGIVYLNNDANTNIGAVDIQDGVLRVDNAARLGGAAAIDVDAGATLRLDWDNPDLAAVISGGGTVLVGDNASGTSSLTLTPSAGQAAGVSPGSSAGTLNVTGNLTLSNDGVDYATLDIEVEGAVAYDQVAVTGNLSVGAGDLAVTMGLPSVNYKPADLAALDIATCGGTLNATPFHAIAAGVFDSVDPTPAVRAAVAAHWTIDASDVTYDDVNGKIVLDASNWTGFTGDADLSDFVDLADLSTLAFNWEKSTGMTWLTADFDLNGTVNLADLSALAFHWEQSASAGAPPIPEPMTVGLLAVGAAALLRRRRR